jgi:2-oxoglutarate dehydrogenase E2 component (dihydrolipoamide succinyltransferase)
MATVNIVVPELSESVVEATVSDWLVNEGDSVEAGDVVVVLETDKVSLEVAAEQSGVIQQIMRGVDEDVEAGEVLGTMDTDAEAATTTEPGTPAAETASAGASTATSTAAPAQTAESDVKATPVARNMAREHGIDLSQVRTGNGGKVDKADVQAFIDAQSNAPQPQKQTSTSQKTTTKQKSAPPAADRPNADREERVKMSRRRRTIASHLTNAQQTAAMLTTFNEIDMSAVMDVRGRRKENFKERHGVSLGFSSFFVKAAIGALKKFPRLNAEIDGDYMILKDYYDIGIAVGADEGLVVPVIRDADRKSFAEIEQDVRTYAQQVRENTLPLEALRGGTFTITNGGVFGSMLSTPILNYPQVGILGLHGIKERPVVIDGEIEIRPWMYVALTYDHRIVDGSDAVRFLVTIKELVEDPESLLIEG